MINSKKMCGSFCLLFAINLSLLLLVMPEYQEQSEYSFSSSMKKREMRTNVTVPDDVQFGKINFYKELHIPPLFTRQIEINLDNVKKIDFGFAIFQIHSFLHNISVFFNTSATTVSQRNGTNVGIIAYKSGTVYVRNPVYYDSVQLAIIIIVYKRNTPMPIPECNLKAAEFKGFAFEMLNVRPLKQIMIEVDIPYKIQNHSIDREMKTCHDLLSYDFYYMHLPQGDLTAKTYFGGIKSMLEIDKIRSSGSLAENFYQASKNSRKFIAISGTGIVVNVIVRDSHGMMVSYIPAVSYSCHYIWQENDCFIISHSIEWIIPAIFFIIIGILRVFVVFPEHSLNLFVNLFAIGTYVAFCIITSLDDPDKVGRSGMIIIIGVAFALVFCAICAKFKTINIAFDITSKLVVSWLLAVCILFSLNDNPYFAKDLIYWSTFCTIMTASFLMLVPFCKIIPSIVSVITGMSAILLGVEILLRSNMLLILLNHSNRIQYADYKTAIGIPQPSAEDVTIFVTMPTLFSVGVYFQFKKIIIYREKTDVLSPITPIITRWRSGSDDVFETPKSNRKFMQRASTREGYNPFI